MQHPGVLLKAHGLRATKRRGQNFLIQPAAALAIARSAGLNQEDLVLEIGPGLGAMTLALASLARQVVAVEVDRGLYAVLQEVLKEQGVNNVELRLADALELDWHSLPLAAGPLKVVANLPYSITSPLLFNMLEQRDLWSSATLLMQREMTDRLLARPGSRDYGRLTVLMQCFLDMEPGLKLGPELFFPHPEVVSRVLHLKPKAQPLIRWEDETQSNWFAAVVKAAFGQRRKTLLNSLSAGLALHRPAVAEAMDKADIDPGRRAETLGVEDFGKLAESLLPLKGQR